MPPPEATGANRDTLDCAAVPANRQSRIPMSQPNSLRHTDEDTSLGDIGRALLRFHLDFAPLLLPLAMLAALAAGIFVSSRPIYQAKGLLYTSRLTLDEWRHLSPLLPDPRLVAGTLQALGTASAVGSGVPDTTDRLRQTFENRAFWESSLQYKSALRRDDLRDTPNADPRTSTTLGIEVSLFAPSRAAAAESMNAIAAHVRQSLLWSLLDTFLRDQKDAAASRKAELDVALTKLAFTITQTETRLAGMRRLVEAYPDLREASGNTIVSPENGGGRYLSPAAQLVALESSLLELQAQARAAQRDLEMLGWSARFLATAPTPPDQARSGPHLADWLDAKRVAFFAAATGPGVQVDQEIAFAIADARTRANRIVFTAEPIVDRGPVASRSPLFVALAVFLASLVLLGLLLAIYRVARQLDRPRGEPWLASRDPAFAWLPRRLRERLFRYERRYRDGTPSHPA